MQDTDAMFIVKHTVWPSKCWHTVPPNYSENMSRIPNYDFTSNNYECLKIMCIFNKQNNLINKINVYFVVKILTLYWSYFVFHVIFVIFQSGIYLRPLNSVAYAWCVHAALQLASRKPETMTSHAHIGRPRVHCTYCTHTCTNVDFPCWTFMKLPTVPNIKMFNMIK